MMIMDCFQFTPTPLITANWIDPWGTDGKHAADWALLQVGSGGWGGNTTSPYIPWYQLHGYGRTIPKCNFFVNDALVNGGDPPGLPEGREYPYTAAEWAGAMTIPGYVVVIPMGPPAPGQIVGTPELGDVLAGGGHNQRGRSKLNFAIKEDQGVGVN